MFARLIASLAIVSICGVAAAAPESYTIDSSHTFPSFEIRHLGFSTQRGRFDHTTGHIVIDREAKTARVEIVVDANSIDTGLEKLEAHLRKSDFFDTGKYPTITYRSTGARFEGDALTALDGQLTMHGKTQPVTLTVTDFRCGTHPMTKKSMCGAGATATIKRSAFGINYGIPAVGDEVKLFIQVEAFKSN